MLCRLRIFLLLCLADLIVCKQFNFVIDKQWNGEPTGQPPVRISLIEDLVDNSLKFIVKAPFYNDPKPDTVAGTPTDTMWKHEVAEIYFMNDDSEYVQVQIGPYGHHMVLLFDGQREHLHHGLPLETYTMIDQGMWEGQAIIPGSYLPPKVTKFNAFMQNGPKENRKYWALYPADDSSETPDFHQLKYFKPIDLDGSYTRIDSRHSDVWEDAHERKAMSGSSRGGMAGHLLVVLAATLLFRL